MNNGIYDNISITDYHANRTHISATSIKKAKRSLKEFHWSWTGLIEQDVKRHFDFGNAFELALLDRKGFENTVAIEQTEAWTHEALLEKPELKRPKQSKRYQQRLEEFYKANEGLYIIPDIGDDSFTTIERMLESCYKDEVIKKLITGTEYQLSLFWTHEETGLNLKTRPDICKRKKNVIVNLKTCLDGSPDAFSRDLCKLDYPLQAAVEIMGCLRTGLMSDVDNYFWLVVEKNAPNNATIYEFDKSDIAHSMDELDYMLHKIAQAKREDKYPGYSDRADNQHGILTARIPAFYYNR